MEYLWYCVSAIHPPVSDRHSGLLLRRFEAFERGHSVEAIGNVERKELNFFFELSSLVSFSPQNNGFASTTRPIRHIYHLQSSISSRRWNYSSDVVVVNPLLKSRANSRRFSTRSQKSISRRDSKPVYSCASWLCLKQWR